MFRTILSLVVCFVLLISCKNKVEKVKPSYSGITESIYASGIVKSKFQYQVFPTVSGIINTIYVKEGDTVAKGAPLLSLSDETQRLNRENAELSEEFADFKANGGKLADAARTCELARQKMKMDSSLYFRQVGLWEKQIGTQVELEQRELAYQNSQSAFFSASVKYSDLKRQLEFTSRQSKKNLLLSSKLEGDYTLRSEITGVVYSLTREKGEFVGPQSPLATVGDAHHFILEMQVDEYDILKITKDQVVLVVLDSYKGRVFEAGVTRIYPMMNERTKTFLVEAEFKEKPELLYPNVTFEANIVIRSKVRALLIPRIFMVNDSMVLKRNGEKRRVKTGLKDLKMIEITEGISVNDELIKPAP